MSPKPNLTEIDTSEKPKGKSYPYHRRKIPCQPAQADKLYQYLPSLLTRGANYGYHEYLTARCHEAVG